MPGFHFLPVPLEDDGSVIVEVIYNTAIQESPILSYNIEGSIPVSDTYKRVLQR